jgi:hypothetical protein
MHERPTASRPEGSAQPTSSRPAQPATRLARAVLWLYPPLWRARYGEEVQVLLDDSGAGLAAVASLAWRALPAWIWPPRHLHDREARMRASLGTVLVAWSMLVGVGLVFAQLTQLQGFRPAGHPVVQWSYAIFDAALACSALAATGGVPLWLLMLRRARREHRPRETAYLLLPLVAPAVYYVTLAVTARVAGGPDGVSPWLFLTFTLLGFVTAGIACAGPIAAMHRLRPRGPAVQLAAKAAGLAAAIIVVAGAASGIAAVGLCLWARQFAGYHDPGVLAGYLTVVAALAVVATVGAARGVRAALAGAGR